MKSEILKECIEEIEACLRCKRLINFREGKVTVKIECTAEDRFDCPRLRVFYSEEELKKIDNWKSRRR